MYLQTEKYYYNAEFAGVKIKQSYYLQGWLIQASSKEISNQPVNHYLLTLINVSLIAFKPLTESISPRTVPSPQYKFLITEPRLELAPVYRVSQQACTQYAMNRS